jgi:hypothetical protein
VNVEVTNYEKYPVTIYILAAVGVQVVGVPLGQIGLVALSEIGSRQHPVFQVERGLSPTEAELYHRSQKQEEYTAYCSVRLSGRYKSKDFEHSDTRSSAITGRISGRRPEDYEPPMGAIENAIHTLRLAMERNRRLGRGFKLDDPAAVDWENLIKAVESDGSIVIKRSTVTGKVLELARALAEYNPMLKDLVERSDSELNGPAT